MNITEELAIKVRDVVDAGLVSGIGKPVPGRMCVEAAVCFAMGLPHSDKPTCASPALRSLKIGLNDKSWSSNHVRAAGLRRLAIAQLGSAGVLDNREFVRRVAEMTIRRVVPSALRSAAKVNPKHAASLEAAAARCEQEGTKTSAEAARDVASGAKHVAVYATSAASTAASAAATYITSAAAAGAAADAASAARDRPLAEFAEWVVEILIDMQAPGCRFLYLVPKEAA